MITGAAGFIGSHLADRLVSEGHEVLAVDIAEPGPQSQRLKRCRADITDPAFTGLAAEFAPEVIYHLAAQISVRASVSEPIHDAWVNVLGTVNVLEGARVSGARKVVATSSCAIYGVPDALPLGADAPVRPMSPYAASKLSAEVYLRTYRELYGIDYTTLTLANVYGPRQTPYGEAGVVALFADALLSGRPTRVFGDGAQTRDYVYVADVVEACVLARASAGSGARLNIGTGIQTTDRELHSVVAKAAGASDSPEYAPPRKGDLPASAVDPEPARQVLGWRPGTPLEEGAQATVDWMRSAGR